MTEREGWYADVGEPASGQNTWQPVLQAGGITASMDIWFTTHRDCEEFIRTHVLGKEMFGG